MRSLNKTIALQWDKTTTEKAVADADHREAEFAILVGDAWQGLGLGSMLTDYCLEVCHRSGVQRVTAETAPEDRRMLDLFRHRGFALAWIIHQPLGDSLRFSGTSREPHAIA